jgi:methyl-accepting chemotaxis protein
MLGLNGGWQDRRKNVSTSDKGYSRKKFFNFSIKRKLQLRMLVKIWSIIFASLFLTGIIFYFYSDISVGKSYRLFHVKAQNFLDFLLPVLLTGFFASLILGILAALFFPHAIAGPLYRIESQLIDIGRGNLNKEFKIREGDDVKDLADSVNVMIRELRNKLKRIDDISGHIGELIEHGKGEAHDETLKKIKAADKKLQQAVKEFKLK